MYIRELNGIASEQLGESGIRRVNLKVRFRLEERDLRRKQRCGGGCENSLRKSDNSLNRIPQTTRIP